MPKVVSRLEVTPAPSIVFSMVPKVDKTNKDIVHVKTEKPFQIQFGTKEEQLKEVRAQLRAAQLREERLKRENERIKEVINSAHHS